MPKYAHDPPHRDAVCSVERLAVSFAGGPMLTLFGMCLTLFVIYRLSQAMKNHAQ